MCGVLQPICVCGVRPPGNVGLRSCLGQRFFAGWDGRVRRARWPGRLADFWLGGPEPTRQCEEIVANRARRFVCIADQPMLVDVLGHYPMPVEAYR